MTPSPRLGSTDHAANSLATVQRLMQAALTGAPDAARQAAQQVQAHIAPGAHLSARQHLAIYQRGYYARLLQCLQGQFKALNHALGSALFTDFAREYLQERPSRSATLAVLGEGFAAWLQRNRPDAQAVEKEEWIDFMVDLAEFEWLLYTLFDAPGAEDQGYASGLELLQPRLRLQPCLRLGHYRYPVNRYYQQVAELPEHTPEADNPTAPPADAAQDNPPLPPEQVTWVALVRTRYRIGIFTLLPAQHHLLAQLGAGASVADALRSTAHAFSKPLGQVEGGWARWVEAWGQAGFFARSA